MVDGDSVAGVAALALRGCHHEEAMSRGRGPPHCPPHSMKSPLRPLERGPFSQQMDGKRGRLHLLRDSINHRRGRGAAGRVPRTAVPGKGPRRSISEINSSFISVWGSPVIYGNNQFLTTGERKKMSQP